MTKSIFNKHTHTHVDFDSLSGQTLVVLTKWRYTSFSAVCAVCTAMSTVRCALMSRFGTIKYLRGISENICALRCFILADGAAPHSPVTSAAVNKPPNTFCLSSGYVT